MTITRAMIAATVGCGLALAGPALASTASGAGDGLGSRNHGPAAPGHAPNFAGYVLSTDTSFATMSTTVVLPRLNCGKPNEAIEPSAGDVYPPGSVYDLSAAGMFVGCLNGNARYYPAFTLNGISQSYPTLRARAGDRVVLSVGVDSSVTELSVVDKTTKSVHEEVTGSGVTEVQGVWAGDSEYPATKFSAGPVPGFGKLTFRDVMLDDQSFGDAIGVMRYDRYRGSRLQIATGPFSGDQDVFKTVFKHS